MGILCRTILEASISTDCVHCNCLLILFFSTDKSTKFFQALRTAWVGALLGLGTMSLGLEQDFFQSLEL